MIKKIINKLLLKLGLKIQKIANVQPYANSMETGLKRINKKLNIKTIIDIGAAAGTWTEKCLPIWKNANYILFEPLIERDTGLNDLKLKHNETKITHIKAAAGQKKSKTSFSVSEDLDGSGFYGSGNLREIDLVSVDEVIVEENETGPFLLKLDTHGFEIPIFEGAKEVLKNTNLIIVEVYGFYVAPNSLLFWEICNYLDKLGFRLYDMVDVMRRPKDDAFWQCDAFFIPKDSELFSSNHYN